MKKRISKQQRKKEKMRNMTEGLSTEKKVKCFNFVSLQFQKEKIKGKNNIQKRVTIVESPPEWL